MNRLCDRSVKTMGSEVNSCSFHLFEAQVKNSPDSVAVVYRNEHLTYSELDSRANQLAHYLIKLGVGPEVLVGICAERGIETLIGILAVLKAGGAYLPLDPEYPQQRLSFMLSDAKVSVILTQSKLIERISSVDCGANAPQVVCLDPDSALISSESTTSPGESAANSNLAYVIYTSGSTGEPKGVQIERRGLCNMTEAQLQAFSLQPGDCVLQFSSLSFDASVFEIFMALCAGATLVIVPPESRVPGPTLTRLLREQEISIVTLPPSVLAAMPWEDLPKLKSVTVAGEACSAELVERWSQGRRFFNLYGPTEATVWATVAECVDSSLKPSIGQAITNTSIYLLDEDQQPVSPGEPGELYIAGAGLARGYLNRPELSAEKFIPDPFKSEPGARMYRTGDIGRQLPDGNIEFIGRRDDQVKLRGFRIELGEVEAALRSHPGVRDAVVTVMHGRSGEQQLVAHVVPDSAGWQRQVHESQSGQISQWRTLHDDTYSHTLDTEDSTFNITGWLDSYTGRPFEADQMRRWLDQTVTRINALKPRRVYEIGCGSGMLLSRIAPGCEQYWACDSSPVALDYVRQLLPELGLGSRVRLMEKSADDFSSLESCVFDAVILNSVAQYFPNIDYLLQVLEGAVNLVAPGGFVWVGDLRSLPLLEAFHSSVQLEQADDAQSRETFKARVEQRMAEEQELVIDPAFFEVLRERLPTISDIRLNLKRGYDNNELTRFRYDVVLRVGEPDTKAGEAPVVEWSAAGPDLTGLRQRLVEDSPETLRISGVPNARVVPPLRTAAWLQGESDVMTAGEMRNSLLHEKEVAAIEPEVFWSLGSELGYETEISWSATGGAAGFDVLLWRAHNKAPPLLKLPPADLREPLSHYANDPIAERLVSRQIPALREYLEEKLPHYMVPAAFVLMDALPLTIQGKVDRRALPEPNADRSQLSSEYVAPRTPFERSLAAIWEDVLKVDRVGVNDNFFELGGDSLLGAVLTNALQKKLGVQLYIVALFDAPTINEQAVYLKTHFPKEVASESDDRRQRNEDQSGIEPDTQILTKRIQTKDLDDFRRLAASWHKDGDGAGKWQQSLNPRMGFILTTPRSGSSLLRIMLAGHQRLFAPPELELLSFDSLQQRNKCLSGRLGFMREGLVRALMEIKRCTAEEAETIIAEHEARGDSVQTFYRLLQEWIGNRLLVDKSATYSLSSESLAHAEEGFDDNLYIHLIRHPYGTIRSFEEARLDRILNFDKDHQYSVRQLAELTWIVSHQNILSFLSNVPAHRRVQIQYEELVQNPQPVMETICGLLDVDFDPLMLDPYRHQEQRMIDGPNPQSVGMTDTKFHLHDGIESGIADLWRTYYDEDFLTDNAWQLAQDLGYERETMGAVPAFKAQVVVPVEHISRGDKKPPVMSYSQQRLWFIDRLEPGNPSYNTNRVIQLDGILDTSALERSINEIINRHEVCRTNYDMKDGEPVQIIHSRQPLELRQKDLSTLEPGEQQSEMERLVRDEVLAAFDLARDPLCRALLLRLHDQRHILVFGIHHILSDAWSRGVIHKELSSLYAAFKQGQTSPLPDLPIQYTDYAIWQRRVLEGAEVRRLQSYWLQQMHDLPPMLELPTVRLRPSVKTHEGANKTIRLHDELVQKLKSLSQQESATLFMTLLGAFNILLSRYSRQSDIVIGTPVSGRTRAEFEQMIGQFINMLPIRTRLSEDVSFRGLLNQIRDNCLAAFAHQDYPFDLLVSKLKLGRGLDHHPLFQIVFAYHQPVLQDLNLHGLRCTSLNTRHKPMPYDLILTAVDEPDGLDLCIDYNIDLFDVATIERLAGHYTNLLEQIAAAPDLLLAELSLMTPAESAQLLDKWNRTGTDYALDQTLQQLFEAQVDRTPQAVAVEFADRMLSYMELDQRANQVAHYLREFGIGPGKLVGVLMERSLEMMFALYGILKAGGAYVPIDPEYPEYRIALMLEDANVPVLLTQTHLRDQLPDIQATIVCVDAESNAIADSSSTRLSGTSTAEDLAYVIYTSGTTGTPKGVMNCHKGIVNRLLWMQETYQLQEQDRVLQKTPFSFDVSVWEFFWPLFTGARLVIAEPGGHKNPEYLSRLINEKKITTLHFVPSMLKAYLDHTDLGAAKDLKRVICSGEALSYELQEQFFRASSAELHNLYGPTEAAVDVTSWACRRGDDRRFVPIGRPIANTRLYILDPQMQPEPVGVPGELHIGGVQVARGYLERPELTKVKFIADPFNDDPAARLYKTGDLARYLPDGNIEYLGRIDNQVKLRGFRIELGEIEAVLAQHTTVREASVVCRDGSEEDQRLIAYVVADGSDAPSVVDLRTFIRTRLPDYMVPSAFMVLDSLPLSPNGKLDRGALPAPDGERQSGEAYVEPRSDLERQLADIWRDVLSVDRVGIHDNFFDLGGHSLMATQVVSRVRDALGVELPVTILFEHQTLEELADGVEVLHWTEPELDEDTMTDWKEFSL